MIIKSLNGNKCRIADIAFPMDSITTTSTFAVTNVSIQKKYVNNQATNEVEGINYTLIDTQTFTQIRVKVPTTDKPVITQEQLDASDIPVFVKVPINETIIKPYKIEYGSAHLSIVAPYLELVENDLIKDL